MERFRSTIGELRRRHVFRVAGIYIVAGWVVIQVADAAFPGIDVPEAAIRYVWLAVILGFPLALVFGWRYDITAGGIVRTPPAEADTEVELSLQRTDYVILSLLLIVSLGIVFQLTRQISDFREPEIVASPSIDIPSNSIAVLPLENLSGDPEQAYFVSGMQDALIGGLSRISGLKVTSKTSTLRFGGTPEALPSIATQLGVSKLIEGSVYRVRNRVRITVQLLDAQSDEQLWSESFEYELEDIMEMQNQVARAIAQQVEVTLTASEEEALSAARKVNPAAYEEFLKGEFHLERFTPQDIQLAGRYFEQAAKLDPESVLAYSAAAMLCGFQAQMGLISPDEGRRRCLPPVEKALALDSNSDHAHMAYAAHMTWLRFDWAAGEEAFLRTLELNPSHAEARVFYSHLLTLVGRFEEGAEQMRLALQLDPLNPFFAGLNGVRLLMIDEYEESIRVTEEVMATTPGFGFGYDTLARSYHALGNKEAAIKAYIADLRISGGLPDVALELETAFAELGYEGAFRHAAEYYAGQSDQKYVHPLKVADFYSFAGEVEKALDWFEIMVRSGSPSAPYIGVLFKVPEIRSHPRFIQLLRDMRLDYWAEEHSSDAT